VGLQRLKERLARDSVDEARMIVASCYASGAVSAPIDDDDAPSKPRELKSCRESRWAAPYYETIPRFALLTWPHFEDHKFPHGLATQFSPPTQRHHALNLEERRASA